MLYCIVYKMSNVLNVFSLSVCSLYVCALSYFKEALLNCYNKYNIAIATTSLLRDYIEYVHVLHQLLIKVHGASQNTVV